MDSKTFWAKVWVSLKAWVANLNWKSVAAGIVIGFLLGKIF